MNPVFLRFYADYRRLLIAIGALAVVCIVLAVVTGLLEGRLQGVSDELQASENEARSAYSDYVGAWSRKELLTTARGRIDDLYANVLRSPSDRFPQVDLGLKAIATKFKLAPNSLSYSRDALTREQLEKLATTMNVSGNYNDIRAFIAELEKARDEEGRDLFLAIEQVSLSDTSESGSKINLSVSVSTYFHDSEALQGGGGKRPRPASKGTGRR